VSKTHSIMGCCAERQQFIPATAERCRPGEHNIVVSCQLLLWACGTTWSCLEGCGCGRYDSTPALAAAETTSGHRPAQIKPH